MSDITDQELMAHARAAAEGAYPPYSRFRVGAALLCVDGEIITGVNVENRSFGLTVCAERTAVSAAVTRGRKDFQALFLYTPDAKNPVPPCGACRQVLTEFAGKDFPVHPLRFDHRLLGTASYPIPLTPRILVAP